MQPSFVDATREVGDLLDAFQDAVVRGEIRPILGNTKRYGRVVTLGLREDSDYYISLRQADDSGTLWVGVHESTGELIDEWTEYELGIDRVHKLWGSCRAQLFSSDLESAVASIAGWLRKHSK